MRDWKDRLGIFASATCAVHCAATPILVATLPTLKLTEWMAAPEFHQIAAVVCCSLVALAIGPTIIRFRDLRILSLSSAGLGLILTAAFVLPDTCCTLDAPCTLDCCAGEDGVAQAASTTDPHDHDHHDHDHHDHSHHGHDHAHHDHAHHDHAHHDHAQTTPTATEPAEQDSPTLLLAGIGTFQPWMTPVGGVLLMLAHALNLKRRWKAACLKRDCCQEGETHGVIPLAGEMSEPTASLARAS